MNISAMFSVPNSKTYINIFNLWLSFYLIISQPSIYALVLEIIMKIKHTRGDYERTQNAFPHMHRE